MPVRAHPILGILPTVGTKDIPLPPAPVLPIRGLFADKESDRKVWGWGQGEVASAETTSLELEDLAGKRQRVG